VKVYTTRGDIQVLRAVSVVVVVLFHFYPKVFSQGYLGVDVFFLISGYLLVPKMLRIGTEPNESLSNFFLTRFARLTPALFVTTMLFCAWMLLLGPLEDQRFTFAQAITAVLNLSNFEAYRLSQGNYFSPNPNGLLHTWSLSVEQQLYFVIPLFLIGIRSARMKVFFLHLITVALFFYFFIMVFTNINTSELEILNNRNFFYFSPLFRGFEFLIGGLVRLYVDSKYHRRINQRYFWLPLIIFLTIRLPDELNLIGTLLVSAIILAGSVNPIRDKNFLVKLGNSSYSIYLVHLPVVYIFKYYFEELSIFHFTVASLFIIGLGQVSRKHIEVKYKNVILGQEKTCQWKTALRMSTLVLSLLIILRIGSVNYYWIGTPPTLAGTIECDVGDYGNCGEFSSTKANYLLIGDSHAAAMANSFRTVFSDEVTNGVVMYGRGCPLRYNPSASSKDKSPCDQYFENVLKILHKHKPSVIISQRSSLASNLQSEYRRDLLSAVNQISKVAESVYVISPNYEFRKGQSQGNFLDLFRSELCVDTNKLDPTPYEDLNYLKNGVINEKVKFIETAKLFSGNGCQYLKRAGSYLYWDSNHLSAAGAETYRSSFKSILEER
jgi:peptidoglycan/LPS O-acetylase OafA/YrhL